VPPRCVRCGPVCAQEAIPCILLLRYKPPQTCRRGSRSCSRPRFCAPWPRALRTPMPPWTWCAAAPAAAEFVSARAAHAQTLGRSTFSAVSPADVVALEASQVSSKRSRAKESGLSVPLTVAVLRAGQERRRAGRVCQPAPARLRAARRAALRPPRQAQRRAARACRPCSRQGGARACSHALASLPPPAPPGTTLQPPACASHRITPYGHKNTPFCRPDRAQLGKTPALLGPCACAAPQRTSAAPPPRPARRVAARERSLRPACAGRCSEAERDRIEEQVGAYVRSCTEHISRLEQGAATEPAANPHVVAHRHGAVRGPQRRPARRASAAARPATHCRLRALYPGRDDVWPSWWVWSPGPRLCLKATAQPMP